MKILGRSTGGAIVELSSLELTRITGRAMGDLVDGARYDVQIGAKTTVRAITALVNGAQDLRVLATSLSEQAAELSGPTRHEPTNGDET